MRALTNSYKLVIAITSIGWSAVSATSAEDVASEESKDVPTRLIEGDVAAHVDSLRDRLVINSKERGPFGLFQKPGKEPVTTFVNPTKRAKKVVIPFQTVVDALPVAAVMASEKMFMVGSRSLRVGQVLPLVAGGKTFRVQVEYVRSDQIGFRDLASNKLAVKRLDLLPNGVSAGGGTLTPQGVTPANGGSSEPLQIDLLMPPSPPEN